MKFISTKEAPQAIGPYSQAVEVNGMIYTSGQIALTPEGVMEAQDVENQTHQVMKNLFPSAVVWSIFIIPAPERSCKIIEAITIGPIPSVISEPKSAARIVARNSNLSNGICVRPMT